MNNQYNLTYETDLNQGLASTTLSMLFLYDDSLAHVFTVKTTRDGKPNSLTGYSVHAYFMPSNSEECVYMTGTVDENGFAVVSLEPACYAFIGRFSLVIRAEKGSAVTSIFRGEGYVGQSHTDAILDPGQALPSLAELERRIDALSNHTHTPESIGAVPSSRIQDLHTTRTSVPAGGSVKFRIAATLLMLGRVAAVSGVSSPAVYVLSGYNEWRAPVVAELSAGSGITVSTGGDNNSGWYIEVNNASPNNASFYIIGNCIPTFI